MKKLGLSLLAVVMLAVSPVQAAVVGEAAPAFTGTDTNGTAHNLSDFAGKTVVLEWTNNGCPFVRKHYDTGNMQSAQETATAMDDVVWLRVISSAEGKQGFLSGEEANALAEKEGVKATATLLDPSGEIGKAYGAATTPHMFVINPEGTLVYAGAIDDNSSYDPASVEGATNYVLAALESVKAGESVDPAETKPYGCSVKY